MRKLLTNAVLTWNKRWKPLSGKTVLSSAKKTIFSLKTFSGSLSGGVLIIDYPYSILPADFLLQAKKLTITPLEISTN